MNKGVVFLGILTVFFLLSPYFGVHLFGKPVLTLAKPANNVPTKQLDDLDLMDPVENLADLGEESAS